MPATPVKLTAFFDSDDGWSWSETHHKLADDTPANLAPYVTAFDTLMTDKRRPMLAKDRYLSGIRVSFKTPSGAIASASVRFTPVRVGTLQRVGAAPHVAAKLRMGDSVNVHFSDIYLRGFWDDIEQDENLNFGTAAGVAWKALADMYTAALIQGEYGWIGQSATDTRRGNVSDYTLGVDGFVTFTLDITTGPVLPAVNTLLNMRCARINHSNSTLNRTHVVRVVSPTQVVTVLRTAALEFEDAGTFVINAPAFYKYSAAQYYLLARRAAGRPFGHSPGRARARARS